MFSKSKKASAPAPARSEENVSAPPPELLRQTSVEQKSSIQQFGNITSRPTLARAYLEGENWDLNSAVMRFFDGLPPAAGGSRSEVKQTITTFSSPSSSSSSSSNTEHPHPSLSNNEYDRKIPISQEAGAYYILVGGEANSTQGPELHKRELVHTSLSFIAEAYNQLRESGIPRERIITMVQLQDYFRTPWLRDDQYPKVMYLKKCARLLEEGGADYDGPLVNPGVRNSLNNQQNTSPKNTVLSQDYLPNKWNYMMTYYIYIFRYCLVFCSGDRVNMSRRLSRTQVQVCL